MCLYHEMQGVAGELLAALKQGSVVLTRTVFIEGAKDRDVVDLIPENWTAFTRRSA